MKKILFALLLLFSSLGAIDLFAQNNLNLTAEKTRTVHFFIYGMESEFDSDTLIERLNQFPDNILSINVDLNTQMCSLEVKNAKDDYLERIIFYLGYKAFKKPTLPPAGFKYVFNPDGTWKLKAI